jgi:glycine/D-amino acid oxidase-like deaminating enzyme
MAFLHEVIRSRIRLLLPFLPEKAIQELRIGRRSMTGDGLPAIGWLNENIYLVATHSGVTLAPAIADRAAVDILSGGEAAVAPAFRPHRLLGTVPAGAEPLRSPYSAQ